MWSEVSGGLASRFHSRYFVGMFSSHIATSPKTFAKYFGFLIVSAALLLVSLNGTTATAQESQGSVQAKKNVQTAKPGQTKKTKNFNRNLNSDKGMWLRAVPDPLNGPLRAASWTNQEIQAPNAMYPATGDPQCGDGFADSDGYWRPGGPGTNPEPWPGGPDTIEYFKQACQDAPELNVSFAEYATVGMTASGSKNFDVGTYYPTDSNSLDKRAVWDGTQYLYPSGSGAALFSPAQQNAGRGCHNNDDQNQINQVDARPSPGDDRSLLGDFNCSCNTNLSGDNWSEWVSWWLQYAYEENEDNTTNYWFKDNELNLDFGTSNLGKAPSYALDWSACWMTNKSDMIKLQQALWLRRANWWNGLQPFVGEDTYQAGPDNEENQKVYWGWNEIPVKKQIDNPSKWGAMLIKLPSGKTKLSQMNSFTLKQLRKDIKKTMSTQGVPYNSKKKSKVAILIEKRVNASTWERKYKCQGFKFSKNLKIKFQKKTKKKSGYCYMRN